MIVIYLLNGIKCYLLYGNIYDFVVDFKQIVCVKAIYDMHRYLMVKHNISP